ncbi:ribonuclease J [Gulosibacter sp. ACHW.36C]|uniref:Ribonuclease J n=1 Tax=Gulosibacter sediminis TaxID=1729695 RepID=A0ABY4MUL8_9MICO|nr:ribonuclease J [Gulosibacter sediminis]UQN14079.1 ribonuclease J [Gulosibacter sediminis]
MTNEITESIPVQLPPLARDTMRIIPHGGLGEVGRNMTSFELNGKIFIIDVGVLFPESTQPGVDLILPDIEIILDRLDDVVGIFLTHGHEDHIGGVPYLLKRKPDIPLIGSPLTLALVEAKLKEHRITPYTLTVHEGDVEEFGPFRAEFWAVNHSIPDSLGVHVTSKAGSFIHTADLKMDPTPMDGRLTDLRALSRFGEQGVDLFLCDSTNAEVAGHSGSEMSVAPAINEAVRTSTGRVIVSSFASHIHRVQHVINAAAANNRKIALVGRSMVRNMGIALDLGYLHAPKGLIIDYKKALDLPRDRVVFVCTGSQGETLAVLNRIAQGDHAIEVGEGDRVVLASSLVPGNEVPVSNMINNLMKAGADVVHKGNARVHVSGHGFADELLAAYNVIKPKYAMPVHGEFRHLTANANIAVKSGVDRDHTIVTENGGVIDLAGGVPKKVGEVPVGFVYVDGKTVGTVTEDDLKDRLVLSSEGFISIYTVIDPATGKIIAGPEFHARAFAPDDRVFEPLVPQVRKALEDALDDGVRDTYRLSQAVRRVVGRWAGTKQRRRPMIVPVVTFANTGE